MQRITGKGEFSGSETETAKGIAHLHKRVHLLLLFHRWWWWLLAVINKTICTWTTSHLLNRVLLPKSAARTGDAKYWSEGDWRGKREAHPPWRQWCLAVLKFPKSQPTRRIIWIYWRDCVSSHSVVVGAIKITSQSICCPCRPQSCPKDTFNQLKHLTLKDLTETLCAAW